MRVLARPRVLRGQDELAYLMQVLRNTFLTQRRTAARRPRTGNTTLDDVEAPDRRTGERPEEALAAREVLDTIAGLSENQRLALVAVDVLGLSYREAGAALGTREATIATRVFRAREQVAAILGHGRGAADPSGDSHHPAPAPSKHARGKVTGAGGVISGEMSIGSELSKRSAATASEK